MVCGVLWWCIYRWDDVMTATHSDDWCWWCVFRCMFVEYIDLTLSTASRHRDEIRYVLLTNVCCKSNIIWNDIQQSGYIRVYPTIQHQCHEWQWKMKLLTGDERKPKVKTEHWRASASTFDFFYLMKYKNITCIKHIALYRNI
jgi:hypothetical protein